MINEPKGLVTHSHIGDISDSVTKCVQIVQCGARRFCCGATAVSWPEQLGQSSISCISTRGLHEAEFKGFGLNLLELLRNVARKVVQDGWGPKPLRISQNDLNRLDLEEVLG